MNLDPLVKDVFIQAHKNFYDQSLLTTYKFLNSFESFPPIADSFPCSLDHDFDVGEFNSHCSHCNNQIRQNSFRGTVKITPITVTVRAYAWCDQCRLMERVHARINNKWTMRFETEPNKWTEVDIINQAHQQARNLPLMIKMIYQKIKKFLQP